MEMGVGFDPSTDGVVVVPSQASVSFASAACAPEKPTSRAAQTMSRATMAKRLGFVVLDSMRTKVFQLTVPFHDPRGSWRLRIADLDPIGAPAGPVRPTTSLGDNAF